MLYLLYRCTCCTAVPLYLLYRRGSAPPARSANLPACMYLVLLPALQTQEPQPMMTPFTEYEPCAQ